MAHIENDGLVAALSELRPKAQAHRLADYMPNINKRIADGVSHEAIVETLQANGFESLTLSAFRKALYRWRKKQDRKGAVAPSPLPAEPSQNVGNHSAKRDTGDDLPDDTPGPTVVESGSEIHRLEHALSAEGRGETADKYMNTRPRLRAQKP